MRCCLSFILLSCLPYAADFFEKVTGKTYLGLNTIGMYGSQRGYTLVNFFLMYLLGACLRKLDLNMKTIKSAAAILGCTVCVFVISVTAEKYGWNATLAWEYCSPFVVASSVFEFMFFKNLKIKNSVFINSLASASISVYLLNSTFMRWFDIKKYTYANGWLMLCHVFLTCTAICLLSVAADKLYGLVMNPIYRYLDSHTKDWVIDADQ